MEQPILLNMVAKLMKAPNNDVKRAQLYKSLFDILLDRPYDDKGTLDIHLNPKMHKNIMRKLIQETAFAVYQSGREYIHKDELLKSLSPELKKFFEDADKKSQKQDLLRTLMMSFYIQERQKLDSDDFKGEIFHSDYVIEFVHKSLQEYMAAEHIWTTIKEEVLGKRKNNDSFLIDSAMKMIKLFSELTSKRGGQDDLRSLLKEIILDESNKIKYSIGQRLEFYLIDVVKLNFYNPEFEINLKQDIENDFTMILLKRFHLYWYLLTHLKVNLNSNTLTFR
jgi:hypothetical protein